MIDIKKILRVWLKSPEDELAKQIVELKETVAERNKLINSLNQELGQPKIVGEITANEVAEIIYRHVDSSKDMFVSDLKYCTCTVDSAKDFSLKTKVFADLWVIDDHDCDNFSFALQGYWSDGLKSFPFGIAWSKGHAFNIFIDDKKVLWIVEPQTNLYMTIDEAKRRSTPDGLSYYPFRLVLV